MEEECVVVIKEELVESASFTLETESTTISRTRSMKRTREIKLNRQIPNNESRNTSQIRRPVTRSRTRNRQN
jgi:hypothetical protein